MPRRVSEVCTYREWDLEVGWVYCASLVGKGKVRYCDRHSEMARKSGDAWVERCRSGVARALGRGGVVSTRKRRW